MRRPRNSVRLVAVDVDGTLANSRAEFSSNNLDALINVHSMGAVVVLATGRRHCEVADLTVALRFSPYVISSNGAVTRAPDGSLINRIGFPSGLPVAVIEGMAPFAEQMVLVFDRTGPGSLAVRSYERLAALTGDWIRCNRGDVAEYDELAHAVADGLIQIRLCGRASTIAMAFRRLRASRCAGELKVHAQRHANSSLSSVEISPAGCNKGAALARLCGQLGIRHDAVLAIGDGRNDFEMLHYAGMPYLMGNAPRKWKRHAWSITGANDEDGVAQVLESVLRKGGCEARP